MFCKKYRALMLLLVINILLFCLSACKQEEPRLILELLQDAVNESNIENVYLYKSFECEQNEATPAWMKEAIWKIELYSLENFETTNLLKNSLSNFSYVFYARKSDEYSVPFICEDGLIIMLRDKSYIRVREGTDIYAISLYDSNGKEIVCEYIENHAIRGYNEIKEIFEGSQINIYDTVEQFINLII